MCDDQHQYLPRQCSGSTDYCWCVDTDGNKLNGTDERMREGISDESCRAARAASAAQELVPVELSPHQLGEPEPLEQQPQERHNPPAPEPSERTNGNPGAEPAGTDSSARGARFEAPVETVLFLLCLLAAAACMWCQWTGARGRDLTGKEFPLTEMDSTMLARDEAGRKSELDEVPVVVIQDDAGKMAF
jgi:hypothetical protein